MFKKVNGQKAAQAGPSPELLAYRQAVEQQSVIGQKITGLQKRLDGLTAESQELHTGSEAAREKKTAAITQLATGELTQAGYDAIKGEIRGLNEKISEVSEMMTVLEKSLKNAEKEIGKAAAGVQGARFNTIRAHIDGEAEEIRALVGDRVARLACLTAQLNITGWNNCLTRIFPELPFNERIQLNAEEIAKIFQEV